MKQTGTIVGAACAAVALLLGGCAACARDAVSVRPFAPGERISFFGDSITHGGQYHAYLQLFWDTRFPGSGVRIMNCGRSGGTAGGAVKRWNWDLLAQKPDRVFAMFGMNDVGRDIYPTPVADCYATQSNRLYCAGLYRTNMTEIVRLAKAAGKEIVLMTPTPYDQYGPTYKSKNYSGCNDPGLATLAAFDRSLAAREGIGLVELHRPLTEFIGRPPDFRLCRDDRVHPTAEGHLIVFAEILKAMGVSGTVDETRFDAKGRKSARFDYRPKALPFPVTDAYRAVDRVYPLTDAVNREMLSVAGLPAGEYALAADGETIGTFTAEELAHGVNLALLETPNAKIAREAHKVSGRLCHAQSRLRTIAFIEYSARQKGADPKDFAAVCAVMEADIAHMKKMKYGWAGYYEGCLKNYRKEKASETKTRTEEDALRRKLAAFRPVGFTLTVDNRPVRSADSGAVELKNGAEFSMGDVPAELTVRVKRGGSVRFLVEENATTGYQWEATYAKNECDVAIEHRGADASTGLCGAPGKAAFTVTKNAAVQSPSLVEFAYRRSWEKGVKPAKTVRLVLYTIPGAEVDFRYPPSRTLNMLKAECRNRGIELVDWHVHIRGGLTPEMAAEREKACGFRQSAMENHGREWEIFDNARLAAFAEKARAVKVNGHTLPVGIQVNDRDWFRQIDAATRAKFDYILADTMIMGKLPNGRDKRLWLVKDLSEIGDPEKWMDEYVAMNLQILGEPISILANPGYLPAPLDGMHDKLWTEERMRQVIGKAVARGIAIEIQAESPYPSPKFLRLAKAMGAKFSFGTNNYDAAPKDLSRWLEAIVWLDLRAEDVWTPKDLK